MQGVKSEFIQLELKYCERCGALWVRAAGSEVVFCGMCSKAGSVNPVWEGETAGREPYRLRLESDGSSAFWGEGGDA